MWTKVMLSCTIFLWMLLCIGGLVRNIFRSRIVTKGDLPVAFMSNTKRAPRSCGLGLRMVKITPKQGESMEDYRRSFMNVIKLEATDPKRFGGRELLELIVLKWGVAYDLQLRKNAPFGEGSANIYVNVMWRYFGQKSFPMSQREYLEHLEAIARYLNAIGKVEDFKQKIADSKKRPNAYFGYAVALSLDVDPSSADEFFKDLPYE